MQNPKKKINPNNFNRYLPAASKADLCIAA